MKKFVAAAAVSVLAMSSVAFAGGPGAVKEEDQVAAPVAGGNATGTAGTGGLAHALFGGGAAAGIAVPVALAAIATAALVASDNDSGSATTSSTN